MLDDNGGYSEDKKALEQRLIQNEKDHKDIKDILSDIRNKYIPDVIIAKTQIKIIGVAIMVMVPALLGLIAKAIVIWVDK